MEEPARYLLLYGVIILLLALLAGIPYGKAILKKETDGIIFAWRVAHSALSIGVILMLTLTPILSQINTDLKLKWSIAILFYYFWLCLFICSIFSSNRWSQRAYI